jgi:hypothetical protein
MYSSRLAAGNLQEYGEGPHDTGRSRRAHTRSSPRSRLSLRGSCSDRSRRTDPPTPPPGACRSSGSPAKVWFQQKFGSEKRPGIASSRTRGRTHHCSESSRPSSDTRTMVRGDRDRHRRLTTGNGQRATDGARRRATCVRVICSPWLAARPVASPSRLSPADIRLERLTVPPRAPALPTKPCAASGEIWECNAWLFPCCVP